MTPRVLLGIPLLAVASCASPVDTAITFRFADGDDLAAAELTRIEVRVFEGVGDQPCAEMLAWRRASCGDGVDAGVRDAGAPLASPPLPTSPPAVATTLSFDATRGAVGGPLTLPRAGAYSVYATGYDREDEAFLYGCAAVETDATRAAASLVLWRPWADDSVCVVQYHRACDPMIDCAGSVEALFDVAKLPACVLGSVEFGSTIYVWGEADGERCGRGTAGVPLAPPCAPAVVECSPGRTRSSGGRCAVPDGGATACGATIEDDLDCDGILPPACDAGMCVEDAPCTVETRGGLTCTGMLSCSSPRGPLCETGTGLELCDGVDANCNGIDDRGDPAAIEACTRLAPDGQPKANRCAGAMGCRCGDAPACTNGACCGGSCVRLRDDPNHCGRCGLACGPGSSCVSGVCSASMDAGVDAPSDADIPDAVGRDAPRDVDAGPADAGPLDAPSLDARRRDTGT